MLIHVVNSGEVLWEIADNYEANINDIIEINGLINPNLLLVGQSLLIPTPSILYTVKYGDTLWRIANRFGVPLAKLLSINRIVNPNLIYPGVTLTIPQERRPPIEVDGITYVFGEIDIQILRNTMEYLTYLTPFSYIVREDGRLSSINDEQAIQLAISNNTVPIMLIVNYSFNNAGTDIVHVVLNNLEVIDELLDNIISTMEEKGYRGIKFDFENILPEDREAYNNFLQVAKSRLNSEGFFVSTSLMPKYSDEQEGLIYEAYDYEAHGRIVDYVVLMAYKWGILDNSSGPVTPLNNIIRVLDYAVSKIPRDKIFIGLQLYAKDWVIPYINGQPAKIISVQEAMNRAQRYKVRIQYDENSQSPFYFYTDQQNRMHEVWFEDARSMKAKFDVVKKYGIRGISYWNLGYEFRQNWHLLEDNFVIVKD
ncbi:MAG: LysM peptidoglycan-binding domain-containing protein [Sedimentibacter sp.]